jgi:prepilin-type N-terminal cleavage/methylation domain-containing protein
MQPKHLCGSGMRAGSPSEPARYRAFTLVELMVVITIIALLMAILLPALGTARQQARRQQVAGQIANLGMAIDAYHTQFSAYPGPVPDWPTDGEMPPGPDNLGSTIDGHEGDGQNTVSESENLVFGLLGCVAHKDPAHVDERRFKAQYLSRYAKEDDTQLLDGPYARLVHEKDLDPNNTVPPPRRMAPFYRPTQEQLGDMDGDGRPEIVDPVLSGLPILYYRARQHTSVLFAHGDEDEAVARSVYDYRQNSEYQDPARQIPKHKRLVAWLWDWRRSLPELKEENLLDEHTGELKKDIKFSDVPNFDVGNGQGEPSYRSDSYVLISAGQDRIYANGDEGGDTLDAGDFLRPEDNNRVNVEKDNITDLP